jgi:hypothetical protein
MALNMSAVRSGWLRLHPLHFLLGGTVQTAMVKVASGDTHASDPKFSLGSVAVQAKYTFEIK